jgi:hypothetical protein
VVRETTLMILKSLLLSIPSLEARYIFPDEQLYRPISYNSKIAIASLCPTFSVSFNSN